MQISKMHQSRQEHNKYCHYITVIIENQFNLLAASQKLSSNRFNYNVSILRRQLLSNFMVWKRLLK